MYSIESFASSAMNDYKILCKNWLYERRLFLLVLQIVIIGIYTVGLKIKNTTKTSKKKTKSVTDSPICKPVDNIFWLNKIIENIWTSDRRNIESWITTNLAPHIPSSVQLVDFQVGNKPFSIENINVTAVQKISMVDLTIRFSGNGYCQLETWFISTTIKNIELYGNLRIIFPSTIKQKIFWIHFLELPTLDFHVTGISVIAKSFIKNEILDTIKQNFLSPYEIILN